MEPHYASTLARDSTIIGFLGYGPVSYWPPLVPMDCYRSEDLDGKLVLGTCRRLMEIFGMKNFLMTRVVGRPHENPSEPLRTPHYGGVGAWDLTALAKEELLCDRWR